MTECQYYWCHLADRPGHDDHYWDTYVPVSMSGPYRKSLAVGAGVAISVERSDGRPAIYVHLDDQADVDEDAYMSPDEACELVEVLWTAISHAREVESQLQEVTQ